VAFELAYRDRGTVIHRLDPRVKLLWWLSINVTLATWNDPIFLALLLVSVFAYGRIAAIPISESLKQLVPVLPFVALVLVANVAVWRPEPGEARHLIGYVVGDEVPVLPAVPVYQETIVFSLGTMLRLLTLVSSAIILIKTVAPSELAESVVKMGVPPEIGMALSMTIGYIPVVVGHLKTQMDAQRSRAWKVSTANPVARFRAYVPIAIPTFFRSFVATEAMAAAMMSRGFGYDIKNRTELEPRRFRNRDWAVAAMLAVFLVAGFMIGYVGVAKYRFTMQVLGIGAGG
jgi:energy-coupling factor transport system permease protein